MEELKSNYGDEVQFVFRHLPLITIHDKAQLTAEAAEAAGAQDRFWEMHDILFERQDDWNSLPEAEMIDLLVEYAEEIGVSDIEQFRDDLENDTYADKVMADYEDAIDAQLSSTPTIFINQAVYPARALGFSMQGLETFISLIQLQDEWYEEPEQVIDPEKEYLATIETEKGDIVIELYPDTAPVNVNSFVFLAQQDWYQGVTFHRVLSDFVAQGGDPTGSGIGFPGYRCGDEIVESRQFDAPGVVSLANSGPNTNGAQFFITYAPIPQLNPNFTIIGQVVEGLEVAQNLTPRDPQQNPDAPPGDTIIDITVEEKK